MLPLFAATLAARTVMGTAASGSRAVRAAVFWGGCGLGLLLFPGLVNEEFTRGLWPGDANRMASWFREVAEGIRLRPALLLLSIPAGFLLGVLAVSLLLHLGDAQRHASPLFHMLSGATMLGAFFIATDPVSSPVTPRGRLVFGLLIGALVVLIRRFGHYPDGVAFAVLLMNAAAPLIDRYTRPRVYGERDTR